MKQQLNILYRHTSGRRGGTRRIKRFLCPAVVSLLFIMSYCSMAASETVSAPSPKESDTQESLKKIWDDPTFKKQFIGSYGVNAEIEPRVNLDEVAILEKIRPMMAENMQKAEQTLKKQMKPDCSAILDFTLGSIYFQQDKMEDALNNYLSAVNKFPSFRRAWRNLGLIYARNGKYDDSIKAFTRMIELGGGDAYSYGLLGFAYASKQDYQASEAAYRNALLLQPDNIEWRLGVTRCVFKQEKYEDAATQLEVLIERYPQKSEFWLLQAQAYLGMKQPLKAAQNLESLDRMGKATTDSMYMLGNIYLTENLPDLAGRTYVKAIGTDPNQSISKPLQAAELMIGRGDFPQARRITATIRHTWDKRMEGADQKKLLKLEARLCTAEGGSTEEIVRVLEEIVKLDPLDGESLILIGQHYYRNNQPDRAIFYYERAENIEAFEVNAKIRHAQVLVNMGRYSDAIPLLRRVQELKPNEDVARYLRQVERIAKTR
jgi:tetratricopeptide (TPR) repeat protein